MFEQFIFIKVTGWSSEFHLKRDLLQLFFNITSKGCHGFFLILRIVLRKTDGLGIDCYALLYLKVC